MVCKTRLREASERDGARIEQIFSKKIEYSQNLGFAYNACSKLFGRLCCCSTACFEFLNATCCVEDLFVAGVERVACAADFNIECLLRRTHGKSAPANAGSLGVGNICRMRICFHKWNDTTKTILVQIKQP